MTTRQIVDWLAAATIAWITPTTRPAARLMIVQSLALRADSMAPVTSPAASFEFTWAAKTMATMPVGRKQHKVVGIAQTRKLSTLSGGAQ